jgi:Txe/YoeB family toxin of Txe-Axe toxin-antitoxin module
MAENKKQHFVPQFYLRNFSADAEKKKINIFHIASGKHIQNITIEDQAQKDYFYSSELDIEKALSSIEGIVANVIKDAFLREDAPKYLSAEYQALLSFCVTQHYRTLYAADEMDEHMDKLAKSIFKHNAEVAPYLDSVQIKLKEPARLSLGIAAFILPIAYDLRMKLIINESNLDFVTTDNPCVFVNPFLGIKKTYGGRHGLASKGLIILLPLSPQYAIIVFDDYRYKVGGRKMKPVVVSDDKDITEINKLLFLNAHKNIFYKNVVKSKDMITDLSRVCCSSRRDQKINLQEYGNVDGGSILIASHSEEVRSRFNPSFITLTPMAEAESVKNPVDQIRDIYLCHQLEEFHREVEKGNYKASQFFQYMKERAKPT